jgi:RHS repeat-associated protein
MIKPGEAVYYFHNDHLGTPQVLTDDTQTNAWKAVYTPFGDAVPSIQAVDNPFRFPGQYYDQETGLHYNYFRYYNPQTGRYMTPDPIGLEGGINLFAYVRGNPINLIDPKGLIEIQPEVPGTIVPEIVEFMVDKSVGGIAGYECASHFCRVKQIPSDKSNQVFSLCGSILEGHRVPTGIRGTVDIIDACTETCWKLTHTDRFKKVCNICEK